MRDWLTHFGVFQAIAAGLAILVLVWYAISWLRDYRRHRHDARTIRLATTAERKRWDGRPRE